MKNTQSLKLNRDFRRAYKGDNFVGGYTVVYMKKNKYQFNRLGLRVGKATGKAVTRNRLKGLCVRVIALWKMILKRVMTS